MKENFLSKLLAGLSGLFPKGKNFLSKLTEGFSGLFRKKPVGVLSRKQIVEYKHKERLQAKKALGSSNHSVSEPKFRRKMAVQSNRINRDRIRDWKN